MSIGREPRPPEEEAVASAYNGYVRNRRLAQPWGWWFDEDSGRTADAAADFVAILRDRGLRFGLLGAGLSPAKAGDAMEATVAAVIRTSDLDEEAAATASAQLITRLLNLGIALGSLEGGPPPSPPRVTRLLWAHNASVRRREDRMAEEKRKAAAAKHFDERGRKHVGKPYVPTYGEGEWREQD